MSAYFDQIDEILYHKLQPWLEENKSSEEFAISLKKLAIEESNTELLYNFDFHRPFNAKAEFYYNKIVSACNSAINKITFAINEYDNLKLQQKIFSEVINDVLPKRFTDVIEIIKEKHYFVEYINPKKGNFEVNPEHKTQSYVMLLAKVGLVKVYLEIKENFMHLAKQALLSERDIYDTFFNQEFPTNSFLVRKQKENIEKKPISTPSKSSVIKASAISRASFTLIEFNAKSDALSNLFNYLKENKLIAKETILASFKWIFSGKEVASQVIWTGTESELHYFIYLIHEKDKLIKPISRNYWKVVCKCFLKENGTQFNANALKEATKPENSKDIIEAGVALLK